MARAFTNILVDPDPYFEDWMTASTTEAATEDDTTTSSLTTTTTTRHHVSAVSVGDDDDTMTFVSHQEEDGGITIISSVASTMEEDVAIPGAEVRDRLPQQSPNPLLLSSVLSPAPVVTMGTGTSGLYDPLMSTDRLSLNPSSLPSSQLEHLPSVSRTPSQVSLSSSLTSASIDNASNSNDDGEDMSVASRNDDNRREIPATSVADNSEGNNEPPPPGVPDWFLAMETDQEWETWRKEMMDVLAVLGEQRDQDGMALNNGDPDVLLAALLAQQEDLLERNQNAQTRRKFWRGGMALATVTALVAAVVTGGRPRPF